MSREKCFTLDEGTIDSLETASAASGIPEAEIVAYALTFFLGDRRAGASREDNRRLNAARVRIHGTLTGAKRTRRKEERRATELEARRC